MAVLLRVESRRRRTKLDRQQAIDAGKASLGIAVGAGFVRWLTNDAFSAHDLAQYAGTLVGAAIVNYFWWPHFIRRDAE